MKNILIAIAILISVPFIASAQIYVGAKVGLAPNMMLIQNNANHKNSPKVLNFLGGVMVEIPIFAGFSIQPEFQFVQKGTNLKAYKTGTKAKVIIPEGTYYSDYTTDPEAKAEDNDNGLANVKETYSLPNLYENIKIKTNYIEGQLLFKYEFVGGETGLYVELGPYYSIGLKSKGAGTLVDAKGKSKSANQLVQTTGINTTSYTDLAKSNPNNKLLLDFDPFKGNRKEYFFKKNDLGLLAGVGLYKELGESRMYFDLRFLYGLSNLNKVVGNSSKIRNIGTQLSITYLFPIGG